MDEIEFFAPWRLVAAFADGSRLLFDGLTEEQARDAMEAAQEEHGDIGYWNRVTDQNYEDGRYYKTVPPPPCASLGSRPSSVLAWAICSARPAGRPFSSSGPV